MNNIITKRDYFASAALQGYISKFAVRGRDRDYIVEAVNFSYNVADVMLERQEMEGKYNV